MPSLHVILKSYKVPCQLIDIIKEMYTDTWCQVRTAEGFSDEFRVESGVRQGCILSPLLFNCFMDTILTLETTPGGWSIEYTTTKGLFLTYVQREDANKDQQPEYPVYSGQTGQGLYEVGDDHQWGEDKDHEYQSRD